MTLLLPISQELLYFCHGIPDQKPIQDGHIVNVDVTVYHCGYHRDLNETFFVGKPEESVHGLLSGILLESPPFEYLLQKSNELYDQYPPESIENDVRDRMKRIEEALVPKKPKQPIEKFGPKFRPPSKKSNVHILKSFVFVTAPVLIGVFLYRFVQNQYI